MDEFYEKMISIGSKLGLEGGNLLSFVEEKYERRKAMEDRENRLKERNVEKEILEQELEMKRLSSGVPIEPVSGHSHKDIKAKVPKLPPFDDARENIEDYLQRFERYSVSVGWVRGDWALHLSALLKGKALAVYSRLSPEKATDYETLKEALYKRFQLSEEGFRQKFRNSFPEGGETPSQFAARLEHYLLRWMELGNADVSFEGLKDLVLREQFYSSCGKNLGMFLREKKLGSIGEVTDQAEKYIEAHGYGEFLSKRNVRVETQIHTDSSEKEKAKMLGNSKRCYGCGKFDHKVKDCKAVSQKAAFMTEDSSRPEYSQHSNFHNSGRGASVRGRGRGRGGRRGYGNSAYRYNEPRENSETGPSVGCCMNRELVDFNYECSLPKMSAAYQSPVKDTGVFGNMPTAEGFVGGKKVTALRDTGCSGVVVRRDLVNPSELTGAVQHCVLVDGTVRKFPKALIEIHCPFYSGKTEALCVERPVYPLIIGNIPGLREANYSLDIMYQNDETKDGSKGVEMSKESGCAETDFLDREIPTTESDPIVPVSAVQTRAQKENERQGKIQKLKIPSPIEAVSRDDMKLAQEKDETLTTIWELAKTGEKKQSGKWNSFWYLVHNGLLYRKFESPKSRSAVKQLVVPKPYREYVMKLGHEGLLAGHLGYKKCVDKILTQFHWPGVLADVKRYCQSCAICQRTSPKGKVCKAPLGDMPIIDTPFQRVAVDLIGPISPSSDRGHRYILTVVDFATRYPEACPLKTIETEEVAEALVQIFCRVGFPRELLSDRGTQFLSGLMNEVSRLLSIKQLVTTPYHPACNGLVEKMNGTLKAMIKKLCSERPKDWDRYITPALFAYREAPQASTGFSPFELIYGWKVRGPLEILKEIWTKELESEDVRTVYQYVLDLRERLEETLSLAHQELAKSKERYKFQYNKKARGKNVKVGDKVLILLPTKSNKLLLQWKGPYNVEEKVGDVDFKVKVNGKLKVFHANMVKKFFERTEPERAEPDCGLITNVCATIVEEEVPVETEGELAGHRAGNFELPNLVQKETVEQVKINPDLTEKEQTQLKDLLDEFQDILTDLPGKTDLVEHEIRLTTDEPIRSRPYPIPHALKEVVENEVQSMKDMGIIEPSESPYCSPIVLVKKSDGSYRFCADMRKVNQATIFDAEPMPDPEEIFCKLSNCKYFSKIDLSKGYWQIPMSDSSKKYTSFATSSGLWQFRRMPFGLVTAPSSFSRMMRKLLDGLKDLDNFLDDILIFTQTWEAHLEALRALFTRLRSAYLTARPSKCLVGFPDLEFLGHNVGEGCLKPVSAKLKSIKDAPRPRTKKELRSFLGLVGFYRKFIPNFACTAVPLTDLTRKGYPNVLQWEEAQENAFQNLKRALTSFPILRLPDLQKQFVLRTDASQFGIGAVLLQDWSDGKFPIAYASRKLLPREVNYAVIEKECLAIIWAVQKFHQYLCGIEFILETDHAPLLYLNKSKCSNSRIMRWALILQSYRFHIVTIKGSENVGADYLSRIDQ